MPETRDPWARFWESEFIPFLVFLCILGALLWVVRVVLENRRWGRRINMQSDTHAKLLEMLEKFSSNEELLAYMRSEAGKRFMDAAILSSEPQESPRNNPLLNRVLTPLQAGIVLLLAGAGVWTVHIQTGAIHTGLGVLGMLGLLVGLGFIISAIVAWALGRHLGLLPAHLHAANGNAPDAGSRP
jgi:hypothetical protein